MEAKTIEKKKYICKRLRRGALPKQVIEEVMEKYGIAYDTSYQLVYGCNKDIKDNLKDLAEDAANYLLNNLQSLAEQALEDGDKKSALKAYELLAKVTKVGSEDGKTTVDINFGFEFDRK